MKRLFTILLMFVALVANAENANALLGKVADKLTAKKTFTVTFRISDTENGVMTGDMAVSGEKFAFDAGGRQSIFDGKTQWTIDPDVCEVNISEPTEEEILQINPFAIIKSYKTAYKTKLLKSAAGQKRVELTPKTKSSLKSIVLVIEEKTMLPKSITMTMDDGSRVQIDITSLNLGVNIPASRFVVNKKAYPGYDFIDMR